MYRRIERELILFTERCLREYHVNLAELKSCEEYLRSMATKSPSDFSDTYGVKGGEGVPSLQRMVESLDRNDNIKRLEHRTQPITDLLSIIADDDSELIKMKYWQNKSWSYIADMLHVSESTARRWRNKLVYKTAQMIFGRLV